MSAWIVFPGKGKHIQPLSQPGVTPTFISQPRRLPVCRAATRSFEVTALLCPDIGHLPRKMGCMPYISVIIATLFDDVNSIEKADFWALCTRFVQLFRVYPREQGAFFFPLLLRERHPGFGRIHSFSAKCGGKRETIRRRNCHFFPYLGIYLPFSGKRSNFVQPAEFSPLIRCQNRVFSAPHPENPAKSA